MTIECGGYKAASFLLCERGEDYDEPGKMAYIDSHFPNDYEEFYSEFNFIKDEDQEELPTIIYNLTEEIKTAFENDSCILAGMGLRTLVEAMCLQHEINGKTLQDKIKNLHFAGLVSSPGLPIHAKLRNCGYGGLSNPTGFYQCFP